MFQIRKESQISQAIPDDNAKGLVSEINVLRKGTIEVLNVSVKITHGFIGDLTIVLQAPSGEKAMLHDRAGGKTKNLDKTYDAEKLKDLLGSKAFGKWTLTVIDHSPRDNGRLENWAIDMRCSEKQRQTEILLPSKAQQHLESVQECRFSGRVTDLNVMVDIAHPNTDDLQVELLAPSGNAVALHRYSGGQKNLKKTYKGDAVAQLLGEKTKGKWTLRISDKTSTQQGQLRHWKISFKYNQRDDLKKVEGIGPKIEQLLNGAGIFSFSRLSVTSPGLIKNILTEAGPRYKMHDPQSWPMQAEMAASGDWVKLNQWQDEHDGGRMN